MERPKAFLVPVSDYEVLEVKETRVALKNVSHDRNIKIGGGREASLKHQHREPPPEKEEETAAAEEEQPTAKKQTLETAISSRMEKRRDRRRRRHRRSDEEWTDRRAPETPSHLKEKRKAMEAQRKMKRKFHLRCFPPSSHLPQPLSPKPSAVTKIKNLLRGLLKKKK